VEPVMNMQDILKLLPHRYPFLLVDKVISLEPSSDPKNRAGTKIVAVKNLTMNEQFFQGHFPGFPVMPGVLQIEAMAQAACLAFARKGEPPMNYFIAGISEAKFRRIVIPGDILHLHAEITRDRGSILIVKTEAKVDGQVASEAEIMAKVAPKDQI
jgi:3-hydroxyacyl-[acyl-carrier-protein] dehydratase